MFNRALFQDESLKIFFGRVKAFSFETKAISCYQADNKKKIGENLQNLLEEFEKFYFCNNGST